jgi:glycosyltransferase involved in cell wall biosynthesis
VNAARRPGETRVLVNLCWLVPGVVGGSEDSLAGALRAVAAAPPDDLDIRLAVLEPFLDAHPDLAEAYDCTVLRLDGRNKVRRVLAEQSWLAGQVRRSGAHVVHHAGGVVPVVHPGRVVLTIQDLQPLDLPGNFPLAKRAYIKAMVGRSARAARTVTVPSGFTRSRVIELLGADPDRVRVVPWSAPSAQPAHPGAPPGHEIPEDPYLLYPAITYPHKNHAVLLDAFALVARERPAARLVLTGGEGAEEAAVRRRMSAPDLVGRVQRPGRVPRGSLERLYGKAAGVVVPSRYEGFGLPVLEAMVRGCPVVASRAGSLPEVARAEDLVDPDDVTGWAAAMQCVLDLSEQQRSERVTAGRQLAAAFSPGATASGLLRAYRGAGTDPS